MDCQFILLLTNRTSDLLWIIEQPLDFRWLLNEVWGWYNLSYFEIGKERRRAGWRFTGLLQKPWVRSWPTYKLLKEFIEAFFPRKQKRNLPFFWSFEHSFTNQPFNYIFSSINLAFWKTTANRAFNGFVIPAQAGIQSYSSHFWIPVFTGMTTWVIH